MDPNANLKEQLEIAARLIESDDSDDREGARLGELVIALNEWIVRGGFVPSTWWHCPKMHTTYADGKPFPKPCASCGRPVQANGSLDGCKRCGKALAYPGAIYCGAACCALEGA